MTSDRMWMAACLSHSPLMQTADAGDRGQRFRAAVVELRRAVEEFHPELVVFFGPDHSRALTDVVPAFTVVAEASGLRRLGHAQRQVRHSIGHRQGSGRRSAGGTLRCSRRSRPPA